METKEFEKRKWSFAHICAYLSLAISLTMLVLWCCNVSGFEVVSLDSFVGVIVTLLAIIVAVAIGYQIYNGFEIKAEMKSLSGLKEKLDKQEYEINEQNKQIRHLIYASLADLEISNQDYVLAFIYLMKSLKFTMSLDKPFNVEIIFGRMSFSVSKIKEGTLCKSIDIIRDFDKEIRTSKLYDMIESRYDEVYKDFISKIKVA